MNPIENPPKNPTDTSFLDEAENGGSVFVNTQELTTNKRNSVKPPIPKSGKNILGVTQAQQKTAKNISTNKQHKAQLLRTQEIDSALQSTKFKHRNQSQTQHQSYNNTQKVANKTEMKDFVRRFEQDLNDQYSYVDKIAVTQDRPKKQRINREAKHYVDRHKRMISITDKQYDVTTDLLVNE